MSYSDSPRGAPPQWTRPNPSTKGNGRRAASRRRSNFQDLPEPIEKAAAIATSLFEVSGSLIVLTQDYQHRYKLVTDPEGPKLENIDDRLAVSLCSRTLRRGGLTVVQDICEDPWIANRPLSEEPRFRFYAGVPLFSSQEPTSSEEEAPSQGPASSQGPADSTELAFGVLSVLGTDPQRPSEEKIERLEGLASMAAKELQLRQTLKEKDREVRRLQSRQDPLDSLLENLPLFQSTPEGELTYANQAFAEMLGYKHAGEVLSLDPTDLYPKGRSPRLEVSEGASKEDPPSNTAEVQLLQKDGTVLTGRMIYRSRHGEEEGPELLTGIVENVSEEISKEKSREERDRTYKFLFESFFKDPERLLGVLGPDGTLLKANAAAMECIEERSAEVEGEPLWMTPWWSEEMRPKVREWVKRAASGAYVKYEASDTGPGTLSSSIEGRIRPVTNEKDRVVSLVISARKTSARKTSAQKVPAQELSAQEEPKASSLSPKHSSSKHEEETQSPTSLLRSVGHEARASLGPILDCADAIAKLVSEDEPVSQHERASHGEGALEDRAPFEAGPSGKPQLRADSFGADSYEEGSYRESSFEKRALAKSEIRRYVRLIRKGGQGLLETLDLAQIFSELKAGERELQVGPAELVAEAEKVASWYDRHFEEQEVKLAKSVTAAPLWAETDRDVLYHVLRSVVNLSLRHTEKGSIVLRVLEDQAAEGQAAEGQEADNQEVENQQVAVVEVEDTGFGIDSALPSDPVDSNPRDSDPRDGLERRSRFCHGREVPEGELPERELPEDGLPEGELPEGELALALAKELIELMGGEVNVRSEAGVGTSVTIRLRKGKSPHLPTE